VAEVARIINSVVNVVIRYETDTIVLQSISALYVAEPRSYSCTWQCLD